jgi:hypothetical protein
MDEDHVDTQIMSRHYTPQEIKDEITSISTLQLQIRYSKEQASASASASVAKASQKRKQKVISCLNALALKIDLFKKKHRPQNDPIIVVDDYDGNDENNIYLISQQVSYSALRTFQESDEVIAAALSLLALCAKSKLIQKRCIHLQTENGEYGMVVPIEAIKSSLQRTKTYIPLTNSNGSNLRTNNNNNDDNNNNNDDDEKEQLAAEVQRRGCIYLGALSDESNATTTKTNTKTNNTSNSHENLHELSKHIVQCGGLECILQSIDWFRYHLHVINWALWSIFNLCYDHVDNKGELIRFNGVKKICVAMKNILEDGCKKNNDGTSTPGTSRHCDDYDNNDNDDEKERLEVARHGIAIFFDLLRQEDVSLVNTMNTSGTCTSSGVNDSLTLNFIQARRIALNAGLHDILLLSMHRFPHDSQIMMMGQQILIATGYIGKIPSYQGSLVCAK